MLKKSIENLLGAPYVYVYPTMRALTPIPVFSPESAEFTKDLNIYIHVPFCDQQCTFCGYLTAVERSQLGKMEYMKAVAEELKLYAGLIGSSRITSINFGGGTPSAVPVEGIELVLKSLRMLKPSLESDCTEISIESTPERATDEWCRAVSLLGFNRVSIGVQSLMESEIQRSGRHNNMPTSFAAIEAVRKAGIPNLCCDLMYGLEGQTLDSWRSSVELICEFHPETIELYRTVAIPGTIYPERMARVMREADKYACYVFARDMLLAQGYKQEAHLRFVVPGKGFYQQQTNVHRGQSLLGVGVGARTYAKNMHYRNVYDSRQSKQAISAYIKRIMSGQFAVESAVMLSREELMRQFAIYQLDALDLSLFEGRFDISFADAFPSTFFDMVELNLATEVEGILNLTNKGLMFRDLIAQTLFSDRITRLEKSHYHA